MIARIANQTGMLDSAVNGAELDADPGDGVSMMRSRATVLAGLLSVWMGASGALGGQEADPALRALPTAQASRPEDPPAEAAAVDATHGAISGVVTDAVTGQPLAGMRVSLARGWDPAGWTTTTADGAYTFTGLYPSTDYYRACVFHYGKYQPQAWYRRSLWESTFSCEDSVGDFVSVVAGQTTTGIDFPMLEKGKLSGRLTDARTGLPIAGGTVWFQDGSGRFIGSSTTDGDGV